MAGFTIETKLRPCMVWETEKGLFHCWGNEAYVCEPSILLGGAPGGQVYRTYALIELEDGSVHEVYPEDFRFIPNGIFKQYDFGEFGKEETDEQTGS